MHGLRPSKFLSLFSAVSLVALFGLPSQSQASVWLGTEDIRLKLDVDLLVDTGVLPLASTSWPMYAPDLARALRSVGRDDSKSSALLTPMQNQALRRLHQRVGLIESRQLSLNPEKQVTLSGRNEVPLVNGFESDVINDRKVGLTVTTEQVYKQVAFKVNATAVEHDYRLDGSYIATQGRFGVVSFGAQPRWWGPSSFSNLIWSTQSRPVLGVHWQTRSSAPIKPLPLVAQMQLFAGHLKSSRTPNPNDKTLSMYAGRFEFLPVEKVRIGFSGVHFNKVNVSAGLPVSHTVAALDARVGLRVLSHNYAIYGQAAQLLDSDDTGSSVNTLLGLSSQYDLPSLHGQLHWSLEFEDASKGLMERTSDASYAGEVGSAGYLHNGQSLGATLGAGSKSVSLQTIWSANQGWALKSWLMRAEWKAVDSSVAVYNPVLIQLGAGSGDVTLNAAGLKAELYYGRQVKIEPTVFYQKFKGDIQADNNTLGAGLQLTYRLN